MASSSKDKLAIQTNWGVYWRSIQYFRPYSGRVAVCLVLSFLISLFHFGSLGMIQPLGDILFGDGAGIIEKYLVDMGDTGIAIRDFLNRHLLLDRYRTLYLLMAFVLGITILKNILRFFQEYWAGYLTNKVTMDISNHLFGKVNQLSVGFFSHTGANKLSSYFVNDVNMLATGFKMVLTKAFVEPLKAVACIVLAMMINWKLTLLAGGVFPIALFFIQRLGKRVKQGAKKSLVQQGNILSVLQETFQGVKIVKAYQMEDYLKQKFAAKNAKLFHYQMKIIVADSVTHPLMEILVTVAAAALLLFSVQMVFSGEMSKGEFCAFYAALGAVFDPMRKLAEFNNRMNAASAAGERVFALLDNVPDIQDAPDAICLPTMQDSIEFRGVSFAYQPEKPVLRDISFTVNKGECIAIVGPSGAGKSTIISLLLRFYDVGAGVVLVDGHDIRKVTLASLRSQIGLVTQEAILFNDTIKANIVCGDVPVDFSKIEAAAEAAYAATFIASLGQKYETAYGEGGIDLSGGQKHRVALSRAIFKSPEILVLDEAMANLDSESEFYIKQSLAKFIVGRTTFIIAHRFSTIEKADKIMVIDNGGLEAFGTHQELLANSPTYRKLYEHQILNSFDTTKS